MLPGKMPEATPSGNGWRVAPKGANMPGVSRPIRTSLTSISPKGGTSSGDKYANGQSEFDIWDMCGNVGEWVNDWYDAKYYARSSESDPQGPPDGKQEVYRGGGFPISASCKGILPCRICSKIILALTAF